MGFTNRALTPNINVMIILILTKLLNSRNSFYVVACNESVKSKFVVKLKSQWQLLLHGMKLSEKKNEVLKILFLDFRLLTRLRLQLFQQESCRTNRFRYRHHIYSVE